ncbi:hypothetical protein Kpol_1004p66 [Vanderwaltozyma polyspora DSM 70294]|uniref:Aldehyde dehydrogenase domain-containing protein n=1 Tax=Vanderwaltozyma polyspora (strain ATCC 22028 / DSM 70294 / BCRC 21397 / CBS 2163 / NBRC 10782 / NRRL Y-8283 / UCD 57-17) TaxID=436907 RepID=A7TJC0_VANPO|nr:uncharacterized protein Kpol_1004p66 [Vanderwaltozyma polyspora DSM 70294]EDO17689.1 hypothetical protein Kpol_1004p66 [Vanderwaltozyma polyspora DSM 70294]
MSSFVIDTIKNQSSLVTLTVGLITCYILYSWSGCCGGASYNVKPVQFSIPIPEQAKEGWKGETAKTTDIYDLSQPGKIQSHCPATGQYLGSFRSKTVKDIDEMLSNAESAQRNWSKSSFERRIRFLVTLEDYILKNQDLIARVACRDSGKTMLDASMGEILVTLEKIKWIVKHGEKVLKPSRRPGPTNFFMKFYKGAEIRYEPLGVISSIVSWNYPFHNLLGPIIAALFTGNAIVMKCSEQVVWSSEFFTDLVRECLIACGEDPNLVQLCYCLPPTEIDNAANYFTSHPGFKHITFIGSQPVAHHILKCAAQSLTPVVVELGGKDAFIVLDSVTKLEALSSIILRGTFQSSGQNCIGIERVIVSQKNYDKLVKIIDDRMTKDPMRLGSDIDRVKDVDMGAMISDNRFQELENLVNDAVAKGARLLHGGSRYENPDFPLGHYFQPTVLVDVTPDMKIAQNEVFGPILVMMKASDTNDCIQLANSAPFGLGGSVFGADTTECNYVADRLQTGNVAINDFATFYVCQLPFGGINGSGYGKFGGEEGLLGLCNAKSICFDTLPFVSTQIPPPLDYPIKSNKRAWLFVKSFITGAYTNSIWERIKSLISLAKNS